MLLCTTQNCCATIKCLMTPAANHSRFHTVPPSNSMDYTRGCTTRMPAVAMQRPNHAPCHHACDSRVHSRHNNEGDSFSHRDLKPANVLLMGDGDEPVLMDFGSVGPATVHVRDHREVCHLQHWAHCQRSSQLSFCPHTLTTPPFPTRQRVMSTVF